MWVSRSLALSLLVALTAFSAATAYDNPIGSAGYHDVTDSPCLPCHFAWTPPLKDFAVLNPETGVSAAVGEVFEYSLLVQSTWITDLVRFEPSLDISQAPSLEFATDQDPQLGRAYQGQIPATDPEDPTSDRADPTVIAIEAGVTDLKITLEPVNTSPLTGADLVLNIFPQTDEAKGSPHASVDDNGPGEGEIWSIQGGGPISSLGFGAWVIEAEVLGAPDGTFGNAPAVDYTVIVDKYYNATGETVQFLQREALVGPGESIIFTWNLKVAALPGAGEQVNVAANITGYYEHDDSSTVDWSYTHHSAEVPIIAGQEEVVFDTGGSSVVVVTAPKVGISMSRISEIVGYVSAVLVLASIYTGGMFGKTSRRQLNKVFQSAKRRVAFHNFISYGIILAAFIHTIIFLVPGIEGNFHWTQGLIWGSISILCMFGLGITGALQVPLIRRYNYASWRWTHFGLSVGVLVFTVVHVLLDGGNFGNVQDAVNWTNPLDPR